MQSINPNDLTVQERYNLLTSAIGPRPIAWVSTISESGLVNLAPFSFFNIFSLDPPMVLLSCITKSDGKATKDTINNISQNGQAVINIVTDDVVQQMTISSADYDASINEFETAGVTPIPSIEVKPPRIKESPVQLECTVKKIIQTGQGEGSGQIALCKIIRLHINTSLTSENYTLDANELKLIGRMGANQYVKAFDQALFTINRPKNNCLGFDQLPDSIKSSPYLTGNEIAQFARELTLPSNAELDQISNSFLEKSPAERSEFAKNLLDQGQTRMAFALLMKQPKEEEQNNY